MANTTITEDMIANAIQIHSISSFFLMSKPILFMQIIVLILFLPYPFVR